MSEPPDDEPLPVLQISLRGILLANTALGIFMSLLTTLGFGDASLGLIVVWSGLAVLFFVQMATWWLVMQFLRPPKPEHCFAHDQRDAFPTLPRDGERD